MLRSAKTGAFSSLSGRLKDVLGAASRGQRRHSPWLQPEETAKHGELHSLLMRCLSTASCSSFTFLSSLLHCCSRLFFCGLLRWPSSESLRAAS